jgi:hypothetical protein
MNIWYSGGGVTGIWALNGSGMDVAMLGLLVEA